MRQKSRILRVKEGDENTWFFYPLVIQRNLSNRISLLVKDSGDVVTDLQSIKEEVL